MAVIGAVHRTILPGNVECGDTTRGCRNDRRHNLSRNPAQGFLGPVEGTGPIGFTAVNSFGGRGHHSIRICWIQCQGEKRRSCKSRATGCNLLCSPGGRVRSEWVGGPVVRNDWANSEIGSYPAMALP